MTESASQAVEFLRNCEESSLAPDYGKPEVSIDSLGAEVFVVSDLHLSAGRRYDGTYSGCENFFCDQSFERFLKYAHDNLEQKASSALLVINGDFIDFLRVAETPAGKEEFIEWEKLLDRIGAEPKRTSDQLEASIAKEKKQGYGLQTHDYKSVWKLARVVAGHPAFFDALAEWLGRGHRLIVVKGNHDLEWYWRAVRNYFRLALAERLAEQSGQSVEAALEKTVLPKITFIDHSLVIDGDFHIQHGHQYDPYSRVADEPTVNDGQELNIPFGSFFNRYLLNKIEVHYPFLDNVRPRENLLPLLIRERFPLALKTLFHHIPFTLKLIPKKQYRYILRRVIWLLLAVGAPAALVVYLQWNTIAEWLTKPKAAEQSATVLSSMLGKGLEVVKNFGFLVLSYVFSRFVAYFQLVEPDSLSKDARKVFSENSGHRLMTFGHTHNPDQFKQDDRWFYNTGTWIPILEVSSADVRNDKTYTYLHIRPGPAGGEYGNALKRWNDEGNRAESLIVINKN
jgi:UDP-2,3-diacylglucosamine pyrophosphatase LpxH